MTCIVGMLDKETNKVIIGGDSAATNNYYSIEIRKESKVFKIGDFVIGCTSSYRMIQLLKFSFKPPEIGDRNIFEYLCTDFVNGIRECFKNGGFIQSYESGDERGGTFLVGYKDRLFRIDDDFSVSENISNFNACGSGDENALGALCALQDENISTVEKLTKTLAVCELLNKSVAKPFHFLTT